MSKRIFILISVAFVVACESPKEKSLKQIKTMESSDSLFNPKFMTEMKTAYLSFAAKYPDDDQTPDFILKASQVCIASMQYEQAIQLLETVIEKYPNGKKAEEALFRKAYVYENHMQDYLNAQKSYSEFIKKYPNSELVKDAKFSLDNLGKSPEQLLEIIKGRRDTLGS